jgi:hypothetical protein
VGPALLAAEAERRARRPRLRRDQGRRARRLPGAAGVLLAPDSTEDAPEGRWESYEGGAASISAFFEPKTGALLVSVSASVGGCSPFYGDLWALYRVKGDPEHPKLVTLATERGLGYVTPEVMLDIDGDGALEFLSGKELYRKSTDGYEVDDSLEEPYLEEGCGC